MDDKFKSDIKSFLNYLAMLDPKKHKDLIELSGTIFSSEDINALSYAYSNLEDKSNVLSTPFENQIKLLAQDKLFSIQRFNQSCLKQFPSQEGVLSFLEMGEDNVLF